MTRDGIYISEVDGGGRGIPLAVKDLFDTKGMRTTYGSAIFRDHVPDRTAEAVARLEAAGYVTAGKANLHEFAWGITSENPHYGTVPNPLSPGRVAGGSSGGSAAALAAGIVEAALGTDSGGSIRIPAACCGIVGFKPTHGLVPMEGCYPLAPSFDHAGPMARDAPGCERMMAALAPGFQPLDLPGLDELRVGTIWTEHADPLVRERVEAAAALFPGARPAALPLPESTAKLFAREAAAGHEDLIRAHRALYGDDVAYKIERGLHVSDAEAAAAGSTRKLYREQAAAVLDGLDLIVTPTLAMVAPPTGIGDLALREQVIRLTYPWNLVGAPALALPCGPAEHGLPASIQLVGRPGDDALVLAAGRLLERALAAS